MKRRTLIQSAIGISAAAAVPAQEPPKPPPPALEEHPKLDLSTADAVAGGITRFFSPDQLTALRKLGEIIVPAGQNTPGAVEAGAAEFLDFLLSQSPQDRQQLYRDGTTKLNQEAARLYSKRFADISPAQAELILAPLREAWTYAGPSDPFGRFLRTAKDDLLEATVNSREWSAAVSARSRSAGGLGMYYFAIE